MPRTTEIPITVAIRLSHADLGPIPWSNKYKTAGLYTHARLPQMPSSPSELLETALSFLPASKKLINLFPGAADPEWWSVYAADREIRKLVDYDMARWRKFSAGSGKNGWKLFLLPGKAIQLESFSDNELCSNKAQVGKEGGGAGDLHARIQTVLDREQCMPAEEIVRRVGRENCQIIVSRYIGSPLTAMTLAPILSVLLTDCRRPSSSPACIVLTSTERLAVHATRAIESLLSETLAHDSILCFTSGFVPNKPAMAMVFSLTAFAIATSQVDQQEVLLRDCSQFVVINPSGTLAAYVATIDSSQTVVTFVMGVVSPIVDFRIIDQHTTAAAEIWRVDLPASLFNIQSSLKFFPPGRVLVVAPASLAQVLAAEVWATILEDILENFGAVKEEECRVLVCTDLAVLAGLSIRLVGGVAAGVCEDTVMLMGEVVGEMGKVLVLV